MDRGYTRFSSAAARWSGSAWASSLAALVVLGWLALGQTFHWSNRWQLVGSTVTTVVTFLMVFVIQGTQNRHSAAMQLKLDELINATEDARPDVIGADLLSQEEIQGHRDELHDRRS